MTCWLTCWNSCYTSTSPYLPLMQRLPLTDLPLTRPPQDPHGQVNPLYEVPAPDPLALNAPQKVAFYSPEGTRMAFVATSLQ